MMIHRQISFTIATVYVLQQWSLLWDKPRSLKQLLLADTTNNAATHIIIYFTTVTEYYGKLIFSWMKSEV